jgi:hypothetical protein
MFAVGPLQHQMIVCYDRYGRFQQIPFGDVSREGFSPIDWRQVLSEDLDTHRRKLPASPADQNNVNINEEK